MRATTQYTHVSRYVLCECFPLVDAALPRLRTVLIMRAVRVHSIEKLRVNDKNICEYSVRGLLFFPILPILECLCFTCWHAHPLLSPSPFFSRSLSEFYTFANQYAVDSSISHCISIIINSQEKVSPPLSVRYGRLVTSTLRFCPFVHARQALPPSSLPFHFRAVTMIVVEYRLPLPISLDEVSLTTGLLLCALRRCVFFRSLGSFLTLALSLINCFKI